MIISQNDDDWATELQNLCFGEGPWKEEPDRLEWKYKGFSCLIQRNFHGALCGYVALPPTHEFWKKNYEDVSVAVHGGLTYSDFCDGPICHETTSEEEENVWWLGFDCAHFGDIIPDLGSTMSHGDHATYKTIEWVKAETERLADQLFEKGV